MNEPASDIVGEAGRVLAAVDAAAIPARILGGVGVALHTHRPVPRPLQRAYADIDFVVGSGREAEFRRVLERLGYEADRKFNALYGYKRQLYWDRANDRQLDVFVGRFAMCHELALEGRLSDPSGTLRPADLLLTKLQIVEMNHKDVVDALGLIDQHSTGIESDGDVIAIDRIAAITASDWGWFTTASDSLAQVEAGLDAMAPVDPERQREIRKRVGEIRAAMDSAPKSLRWRARARVGRRMAWFELPEEHVR